MATLSKSRADQIDADFVMLLTLIFQGHDVTNYEIDANARTVNFNCANSVRDSVLADLLVAVDRYGGEAI